MRLMVLAGSAMITKPFSFNVNYAAYGRVGFLPDGPGRVTNRCPPELRVVLPERVTGPQPDPDTTRRP